MPIKYNFHVHVYGCENVILYKIYSSTIIIKIILRVTRYEARHWMCHHVTRHEPQTSDITIDLFLDNHWSLRLQWFVWQLQSPVWCAVVGKINQVQVHWELLLSRLHGKGTFRTHLILMIDKRYQKMFCLHSFRSYELTLNSAMVSWKGNHVGIFTTNLLFKQQYYVRRDMLWAYMRTFSVNLKNLFYLWVKIILYATQLFLQTWIQFF